MTEPTKQNAPAPTRKTRRWFAIAALTFSFLIISYITYAGDPNNVLHESSLSWAFSLVMFVMGAYAFSATSDKFIDHKWK